METSLEDLIKLFYEHPKSDEFEYIARCIELEEVIRTGSAITAPFQHDMKNNAIQHSRTIVNDQEAIKATGVIPGGNKDIYEVIALKVITYIKDHKHES